MAKPWLPAVRTTGKLGVFVTPTAKRSPVWIAVLGQLLPEFNRLAKRHGLRVQLAPSGNPPREGEGAEVAVDVAAGSISFTFAGQSVAETFSELRMHGRTQLFDRDGTTFKAFVFLPAHPQINTPTKPRLVGRNVLMLIALHELVHACGLDDDDHALSGVFQANPTVDLGDSASGDRTIVRPQTYTYMPPYVLDAATVTDLKRLWVAPAPAPRL